MNTSEHSLIEVIHSFIDTFTKEYFHLNRIIYMAITVLRLYTPMILILVDINNLLV